MELGLIGGLSALVEFERVSDARAGLKTLADAAQAGAPATFRREQVRFAVVDADRLVYFLGSIGPRAEVIAEDGGWSLFFPGLPIAAEGATLDEAIEDGIAALRDYAQDWVDHLHTAPNHANNWGLVQLVSLARDRQLREWLLGFTA